MKLSPKLVKKGVRQVVAINGCEDDATSLKLSSKTLKTHGATWDFEIQATICWWETNDSNLQRILK